MEGLLSEAKFSDPDTTAKGEERARVALRRLPFRGQARADRQDGTRRPPEDLFRDTSDEGPGRATTPVRPDDDEVRAAFTGRMENPFGGHAMVQLANRSHAGCLERLNDAIHVAPGVHELPFVDGVGVAHVEFPART